MDGNFLRLAIGQAKESVKKGGFPAGAVIVKDSEIISEGISIGFSLHDPTSHAETAAIREACKKFETTDLRGAVLYESIECCNMCFSVAYWSGISKIIFAARKTATMIKNGYYEGITENKILNNNNNRKLEIVHMKELEKESLDVISSWETKGGFDK